MWRWIYEKCISEKIWTTTSVRFEPETSVVRLIRIRHWATQSRATEWSSKHYITNTYICQDSISICGRSSHKIQVNFDLDTRTKSYSTLVHKTNQFRSLSWNQVKFDPSHWNQVDIDHPDKRQVNVDVHKRFAARIQKSSRLRPLPPTQNTSPSIVTLKRS